VSAIVSFRKTAREKKEDGKGGEYLQRDISHMVTEGIEFPEGVSIAYVTS